MAKERVDVRVRVPAELDATSSVATAWAAPVRDHRRWLAAQLALALLVQTGWRLRW